MYVGDLESVLFCFILVEDSKLKALSITSQFLWIIEATREQYDAMFYLIDLQEYAIRPEDSSSDTESDTSISCVVKAFIIHQSSMLYLYYINLLHV